MSEAKILEVFKRSVSEFNRELNSEPLVKALHKANAYINQLSSRYNSHRENIEIEKEAYNFVRAALSDAQVPAVFKAEKMGWSMHQVTGSTLIMWNCSNRGRLHIFKDGSFKRDS
jgi:hypothetical protein